MEQDGNVGDGMVTDEQAAQLQRSRESPLFSALPTGTYSYRYRDVGTDTSGDLAPATSFLGIQGQNIAETSSAVEAEVDPPFEDTQDPVLYRETKAVENVAMTLISKQVAAEAPTTGAKGRAREREVKRMGGRRIIMPSQGLVDAAKAASPPLHPPPVIKEHDHSKISPHLEYLRLDGNGPFGDGGRAWRPDETLLVGCRPGRYGRRSKEGKKSTEEQEVLSGNEYGLVLDGKWTSTTTLVATPSDDTFSPVKAQGRRRPQRFPVKSSDPPASTPQSLSREFPVPHQNTYQMEKLLEENARLTEEIARLKLEKAELAEKARFKDELARLMRDKPEIEDYVRPSQFPESRFNEVDAELIHDPFSTGNNKCGGYRGDCRGCQREREEITAKAGFGFLRDEEWERKGVATTALFSDDIWEEGVTGLGLQSRRTANRGNRVGAGLMSQEVAVEAYAGGKGRAREREEKLRTHYLTRQLTDSEDDDQSDQERKERREPLHIRNEEYRGRLKKRDEDVAAMLANLPEDVRKKYAADRPSRIWREHSCEILVESDVTGARGRRREVNMKREEPAKFMPSQEMRDAAAALHTKSP